MAARMACAMPSCSPGRTPPLLGVGSARGDATVGRAEIVTALQGKAYLVGEHGALFLVQTEAAGELKFVGRLVVGVPQVGEEEFAEIHVINSSHDARAVLWDWR